MDPERPIEKTLRDCGRQRAEQAGAPFELHPATRRLLQGEVARQFPPQRPSGSWVGRLFLNSGPKLAWGAALVSVLLIMGALFLSPLTHSPSEPSLAQNRARSMGDAAAEAPAPMELAVTDDKTSQDEILSRPDTGALAIVKEEQSKAKGVDSLTNALTLAETAGATAPAAATSAVAPPPPVPAAVPSSTAAPALPPLVAENGNRPAQPAMPAEESTGRYGLARNGAFKDTVVQAAPSQQSLNFQGPANTALTFSVDRVEAQAFQGATNVLGSEYFSPALSKAGMGRPVRFYRAPSSTGDTTTTPVLVSFEAQQSDRQLRIVDRDGSVYTGYLQPAPSAAASGVAEAPAQRALSAFSTRQARPQAAPATLGGSPPAGSPASAAAFSFRVAGTNRTLKTPVVFSGNILPGTNAPAFPMAPATVPLFNSRVSGRALIGDRQQIEINAVPAALQR